MRGSKGRSPDEQKELIDKWIKLRDSGRTISEIENDLGMNYDTALKYGKLMGLDIRKRQKHKTKFVKKPTVSEIHVSIPQTNHDVSLIMGSPEQIADLLMKMRRS